MRTVSETRKHLKSKGYSEEETDRAIAELVDLKYLDDYQYALRYYEYNHEKKRGVLRAERELAEKGLDRETVLNAKEDFLYEQKVDEYEEALTAARKEMSAAGDLHGTVGAARELDDRMTARIARKLEAKGYSRSDIFRVLDTLRGDIREERTD